MHCVLATHHKWTGVKSPFVEVKGPVIDNVPTFAVDCPNLSGEGRCHNVLVAISIHVKKKGSGSKGGVTEGGGP